MDAHDFQKGFGADIPDIPEELKALLLIAALKNSLGRSKTDEEPVKYAHVHILGHDQIAGKVTEVTMLDEKFLRVETIESPALPEKFLKWGFENDSSLSGKRHCSTGRSVNFNLDDDDYGYSPWDDSPTIPSGATVVTDWGKFVEGAVEAVPSRVSLIPPKSIFKIDLISEEEATALCKQDQIRPRIHFTPVEECDPMVPEGDLFYGAYSNINSKGLTIYPDPADVNWWSEYYGNKPGSLGDRYEAATSISEDVKEYEEFLTGRLALTVSEGRGETEPSQLFIGKWLGKYPNFDKRPRPGISSMLDRLEFYLAEKAGYPDVSHLSLSTPETDA